MSAITSGSTQHISEQDAEVQQGESASSNRQAAAEAEAVAGQTRDNAEGGTESANVAEIGSILHASPDDADESMRPQPIPKEGIAASDGSTQDSHEGSVSTGGSSTESEETSVSSGGNSTESQEGATGGAVRGYVLRASDINRGKEPLQEYEKQVLRAIVALGPVVVDPNKPDSQDSSAIISSGTWDSAVVGGSSRVDSFKSGVTGGISNSTDSPQNPSNATVSLKGVSVPVRPPRGATKRSSAGKSSTTAVAGDSSSADSLESATKCSRTGNSFKTAVVGDSSSADSLESGVAGGISNSPDSLENPSDAMESFDVVGLPLRPPRGGVVAASELVDEREHVRAGLLRGYQDVFNTCACVCDYVKPCSRRIRKSKICSFLKLMLTVIPLSAFYMGMHFSARCPVKVELPILMMLMGVLGVCFLTICLGFDFQYILCPDFDQYRFKVVIIILSLILLVLFIAGLGSTYSMAPSFDPADHAKYCAMSFYYFAYYMNSVVIGIVLLCFFIYVPTRNETFEEEYERLY